jgi:hypothetical protein
MGVPSGGCCVGSPDREEGPVSGLALVVLAILSGLGVAIIIAATTVAL